MNHLKILEIPVTAGSGSTGSGRVTGTTKGMRVASGVLGHSGYRVVFGTWERLLRSTNLAKGGAPCMNYVTLLKKDTGLDNTHEIETVMLCTERPGVEWPAAQQLRLGEVTI